MGIARARGCQNLPLTWLDVEKKGYEGRYETWGQGSGTKRHIEPQRRQGAEKMHAFVLKNFRKIGVLVFIRFSVAPSHSFCAQDVFTSAYQFEMTSNRKRLNELSGIVLDAAITVHKEMGPGLLETVYQQCLVWELLARGLAVQTSVMVPLVYKGHVLTKDYVIDILVENELIVELKAVENVLPVHEAQIISYLKLADKRLGLLINFNVDLIKNGFKRFVNNF